jgi:thiol-disulfide isomerase/thioredoxin
MPFRLASLLVLAIFFHLPLLRGAEPQGRLIVNVSMAGTGAPVPGAKVNVNLGILESDDELATQITNDQGRHERAVPLGNLRILTPTPPVGYWIVGKEFGRLVRFEQLAITRSEPTIERSFEVQQAVVWPAKIVLVSGKPVPSVRFYAVQNGRDFAIGGIGVTDENGDGPLTLPRDGGNLGVHCSFQKIGLALASRVQLQISPGFDHTKVVRHGRAPEGDRIDVFDDQDRKASFAGCRIVVREGTAQLILEVPEPSEQLAVHEINGQVVDQGGNSVKDATVTCQCAGIGPEDYIQRTNEQGTFRFRGQLGWSPPGQQPYFEVLATKDGHAPAKFLSHFVPDNDGNQRLKDALVLKPGYSTRLNVLQENGEPAEGAWVEYQAGNHKVIKTDSDGNCTLQDLPDGATAVRVSFGKQMGNGQINVGAGTSPAAVVSIRLKSVSEPLAPLPRQKLNRVVIGETAPEWNILQWSDGKDRSLASQRGRIVVIEFWDMGCQPCRQVTMPVSNKIERKWANDVTFVHIHPAGIEPSSIYEMLAANHLDLLVGIDQGKNAADSETLKKYGINGFPTCFILDREGRVLDNGKSADSVEEEMAKRKTLAEEAGLPWPIEKDASEAETIQRLRRFHEHWMTKKIEAALGKPSSGKP